jgi:hypothetical protein
MKRIDILRGTGLFALALLATCPGCGSGAGAYTPSAQTARQSLEAALTAWQEGKPPGRIDATNPPVQVVDSAWQAGEKLSRFEVLREEESDDTKQFTVRLEMKTPAGQKEVHYVVHGLEPVWVYREEDFARALNMDNNPPPKPARTARRRR